MPLWEGRGLLSAIVGGKGMAVRHCRRGGDCCTPLWEGRGLLSAIVGGKGMAVRHCGRGGDGCPPF